MLDVLERLAEMPVTDWGWQITPAELESWILQNDEHLLVVDKPGLVVCHPSKHGPWSSLIGACREYLGLDRLHMPFRLDRETSGVVVLAKDRTTASRLQTAVQMRQMRKTYFAILTGELQQSVTVNEPLGRDVTSPVYCRRWVVEGGQEAQTEFVPLAWSSHYTLVRVHPYTGRLHQIRVHASWLGHSVVGDKLYGPDQGLWLELIVDGFTPRLASLLPMRRQALHAGEITFVTDLGEETFRAPLPRDMAAFCAEHLDVTISTGLSSMVQT